MTLTRLDDTMMAGLDDTMTARLDDTMTARLDHERREGKFYTVNFRCSIQYAICLRFTLQYRMMAREYNSSPPGLPPWMQGFFLEFY